MLTSPFDLNPDLIFLFRLAKDLGKTVGQLKRELTTWEFLLWAEFYKREHDEVRKLHERMKRKH